MCDCSALTGGGRKIIRVEISLDDGVTWQSTEIRRFEKPNAYGEMLSRSLTLRSGLQSLNQNASIGTTRLQGGTRSKSIFPGDWKTKSGQRCLKTCKPVSCSPPQPSHRYMLYPAEAPDFIVLAVTNSVTFKACWCLAVKVVTNTTCQKKNFPHGLVIPCFAEAVLL